LACACCTPMMSESLTRVIEEFSPLLIPILTRSRSGESWRSWRLPCGWDIFERLFVGKRETTADAVSAQPGRYRSQREMPTISATR
jgi:hypothetical protein